MMSKKCQIYIYNAFYDILILGGEKMSNSETREIKYSAIDEMLAMHDAILIYGLDLSKKGEVSKAMNLVLPNLDKINNLLKQHGTINNSASLQEQVNHQRDAVNKFYELEMQDPEYKELMVNMFNSLVTDKTNGVYHKYVMGENGSAYEQQLGRYIFLTKMSNVSDELSKKLDIKPEVQDIHK